MSEKYTGDDRDAITIGYNIKRCIHAQHCVHNLPAVFDTQKRPWINANGALHYDRSDGIPETPPAANVITVRHNGPLEICGDLSIHGTTAELLHETRGTLCRCGASGNKPFCDNTHKRIAFVAD